MAEGEIAPPAPAYDPFAPSGPGQIHATESVPLKSDEAPGQIHATDELKNWLTTTVGLPCYYNNFVKNGFETLDTIKYITKEDLIAINITLRGHQIKILSEIEKLGGNRHTNTNQIESVKSSPKPKPKPHRSETEPLMIDEVRNWLATTVGLPQYYNNFVTNGFETLEIIKSITKQDLIAINITLKGHQIKIISEIEKLCHDTPDKPTERITASTEPFLFLPSTERITAFPPPTISIKPSPKPKTETPIELPPANDDNEKKFRIVAFIIAALASLLLMIGLIEDHIAYAYIGGSVKETYTCGWTEVTIIPDDTKNDTSSALSYTYLCEEMEFASYYSNEQFCTTKAIAIVSLVLMLFAFLCALLATLLVQPWCNLLKLVNINHSLKLYKDQKTKPYRALLISAAILAWVAMILFVAGDQACLHADGFNGSLGTSMILCIVAAIFATIAIFLAK